MTNKVTTQELKELVSKVREERALWLPALYDKVKTIIADIDGSTLNPGQYGNVRFEHEGIQINAKIDSTANPKGKLDLVQCVLADEIKFPARGREVTYPKGMIALRLYASA